MNNPVERCTKCSLPTNFPGILFDTNGVCNMCLNFDKKRYLQEKEVAYSQLVETLSHVKVLGKKAGSPYDAIVALSGGKDSCFTLKYLVKEHGLSCLAITVDNGFLSDQSILNSRRLCDQLHDDFNVWRPKISLINSKY